MLEVHVEEDDRRMIYLPIQVMQCNTLQLQSIGCLFSSCVIPAQTRSYANTRVEDVMHLGLPISQDGFDSSVSWIGIHHPACMRQD